MRSRWFGLVIAAVALIVSIWAYPQLPPTIATHWNVRGTADGFSSRATAVVIIPLVLIGLTGLFNVLPKLDPRRANYAKFIDTYWLIANAVILFILIGHGMIVATGLGYPVKIDRFMPIGVGLLFIVLGGFLLAASVFLPHGAFLPLLIAAILIVAVIPVVQSYVLWKREQGKS